MLKEKLFVRISENRILGGEVEYVWGVESLEFEF